jgi:hypothetical protein
MKKFSEIFYESKNGKKIWNLYSEPMKLDFRNNLVEMEFLLTRKDITEEWREERWTKIRRLSFSYNMFHSAKYTNSGLCSKDSYEYILNGKGSKLVKDHYYGVTEVSEEIRRNFESSNFDIDYMVNEWLPKNYHLFVTWHVTPTEHKKENIARADNTLEEKDNFEHLIKVSEVVEKKTKRTLLKEI